MPGQPPPEDNSPALDVTVIQEITVTPEPEPLAKAEKKSFEDAKRELLLEDLKNEVEARRTYAERLFWLMIAWIFVVITFVFADAIIWPWAGQYVRFDMSDSVLITLVTTTTAT